MIDLNAKMMAFEKLFGEGYDRIVKLKGHTDQNKQKFEENGRLLDEVIREFMVGVEQAKLAGKKPSPKQTPKPKDKPIPKPKKTERKGKGKKPKDSI